MHFRMAVISIEEVLLPEMRSILYPKGYNMRSSEFFARIRAAQGLARAFESRREPATNDLDILGMPSRLKARFRR